ncbi:MAG: tetratricopeptide repeat protein [Candidatus Obscuribacter sp.]|jgi:tetratricopeptide (TPR) repeat protein|nr:tetratricopeptide repeat protein [Candidatus Obscuribacter sp.]MBL0186622.1 tetratricopeptide repeat protein [Candidatus Obscuribacter sp.]MBP6349383.1 tetratricopeptide repeat protein [Candidatus Obscuribacter sp.]MBP6592132.1 tetratricopeptide repeat protein [Candidatus Obscuribacter sp.]MBP7576923.1 tetratricopeptide repeat protein [Candidatus Obscuribacter sp.]
MAKTPSTDQSSETIVEPSGIESQYDCVYARAKESGTFGDFERAASEYRAATDVARSFGLEDERLFDSLSRLAYCHYRLGDMQQAEVAYREALELMERFHKSKHPDRFASILWAMAVLLSDSKRFNEAEEYFKRSMAVSESWSGPKDRFVADCLWGLSKCLTGAGKINEAEEAIKNAIAIYQGLDENVDDFLATNYINLGSLQMQRGKINDAIESLTHALTLRERIAGKYDATVMSVQGKLAMAYMQIKNYSEAFRLLKKSLKITENIFGIMSPEAARKQVVMGDCLACQNKNELAVKVLERAKKIIESDPENFDPTLMSACLFELTTGYQRLKDDRNTKLSLEELVHLFDKNSPPLNRGGLYADSLIRLAAIYDKQCLFKKARPLYEEALQIRERIYGNEHKLVAEVLMRLGTCQGKMSLGNLANENIKKAESMLADLKKRA